MTVAGLVLLVVGFLVALSEAHNPTHGVAGAVGLVVMVIGVALTLGGLDTGILIGAGGTAAVAAVGAGGLTRIVHHTAAVRYRRVRTGAEGLIGRVGVVRRWDDGHGSVTLEGAVWEARRSPADEPEPVDELHAGDRVVVERLSGLTLSVRPAEEWELL